MPEEESVSRIIIDNYRAGVVFVVIYLGLIAAAFMSAFGNPTDTSDMILKIFGIASPTDNFIINLVIWFAAGVIIGLILKKVRKSMS